MDYYNSHPIFLKKSINFAKILDKNIPINLIYLLLTKKLLKMKKFFLMLAVALPMFFLASCGDDNDEDLKDDFSIPQLVINANNTLTIAPGNIYLEWGDSKREVKEDMPSRYYLAVEADHNLGYTYNENGAYPFYAYSFINGGLAAATIAVTVEQDEQVDFEKYFKDNGYKDISSDDEDFFTYQSKDKVCLVTYGYDYGDIMLIWVPNTRSDFRSIIAEQSQLINSLKK